MVTPWPFQKEMELSSSSSLEAHVLPSSSPLVLTGPWSPVWTCFLPSGYEPTQKPLPLLKRRQGLHWNIPHDTVVSLLCVFHCGIHFVCSFLMTKNFQVNIQGTAFFFFGIVYHLVYWLVYFQSTVIRYQIFFGGFPSLGFVVPLSMFVLETSLILLL